MNSFSIFLDAVTSYLRCPADSKKMPSKWKIPYIDLKIISSEYILFSFTSVGTSLGKKGSLL